ncbi:hypothetical protein ScPMuIL_006407 [Solemya velum]
MSLNGLTKALGLKYSQSYDGLLKVQHQDDIIYDASDGCERRGDINPFAGCAMSDDEKDLVDKLLRGAFSLEALPSLAKPVVKLFIGGEVDEFGEEWAFLMSDTLPRIRAHVRDKYGLDLHILDLKISVLKNFIPLQAECLRELRRCQKSKTETYYVGFVGDESGKCSPPVELSKDEMTAIKDILVKEGEEVTSLDTWYTEDTNAVPVLYRSLESLGDEGELGKLQKDAMSVSCFDTAVLLYFTGGDATTNTSLSKEVFRLLEKAQERGSRDGSVLLKDGGIQLKPGNFNKFRETQNVMTLLTLIVKEIAEMRERGCCMIYSRQNTSDKTMDTSSLKSDTSTDLSDGLSEGSVYVYSSSSDESHNQAEQEYLLRIGSHCRCVVTDELDKRMHSITDLHRDRLYRIIIENGEVMKTYSRNFIGREEELEVIRYYILSESDQPLVISGISGSGKTALLARAASAINDAIVNDELPMKTSLVIRFLGHTGNTRSPAKLLRSLCQQLFYLTSTEPHPIPNDYEHLQMMFVDLLQRGEFGGMVIVVLDGVDNLDRRSPGCTLSWIPSRIVPNVKLIISATTSNKDSVDRLENKVNFKTIEMDHVLSFEHCKLMFAMLMADESRTLTIKQWEIIQSRIKEGAFPLFIQLLFGTAKNWRSADQACSTLPTDMDAAIDTLFEQLECAHGNLFVSRALGYLTVSKRGLSVSEWEDILSLDNTVISHVQSLGFNFIGRIPSILLVRLRNAIEDYLQEIEIDNMQVVTWRYQVFTERARSRYCSQEIARKLQSAIVDFYMGTWGGARRKPLCTQCDDSSMGVCRLVLEQPLVFDSVEVSCRFNYRKMKQLPLYLAKCKRFHELKSELLCNFMYILNRLKSTPFDELLQDYMYYSDVEVALVLESLRMARNSLTSSSSVLASELLGRLLPYTHHHSYIQRLLYQCDLAAQTHCCFVPMCQIYNSPGSLLQLSCKIDCAPLKDSDVRVFTTPDGIFLMVRVPKSTVHRVWNLATLGTRPDVLIPNGEAHTTLDGRFVAIINGNSVAIYKYDSGELQGEVGFGSGRAHDVKRSRKYIAFPVEHGHGPVIIDAEKSVVLNHFSQHCQAVDISRDDEYFVFNSGKDVYLYELPYMRRRSVGEVSDLPCKMAFSTQKFKCYVVTSTKLLESVVFDRLSRRSTRQLVCSDIDVRDLKLSNNEDALLIHASRCLYLASTDTDEIVRPLTLPPEPVSDKFYKFAAAGFNKRDDLVVASRGNSVLLWETTTGDLLRVVEVGDCMIKTLYLSAAYNKAVTIASDGSCGMLNLDSVASDVPYINRVLSGKVVTVRVSSDMGIVATHDAVLPEVKILNLYDGKVINTLQYSDSMSDRIVGLEMSNDGKYTLARGQRVEDIGTSRKCLNSNTSTMKEFQFTQTDDILWETETGRRVYLAESCRAAVFSRRSDLVVFVSDISSDISAIELSTGDCRVSHLPPETEITSEPCILSTDKLKYFIFVTRPITNEGESPHVKSNILMAFPLSDDNIVILEPVDVSSNFNEEMCFMNVSVTIDQILLITLQDKSLSETNNRNFSAILYSLDSKTVLKCISHQVEIDCVPRAIHSPDYLCILDSKMRFFSMNSSKFVSDCELPLDLMSMRCVLDGRYIVGITNNRREIVAVRSSDGVQRDHIFVHGLATCLEVAADGRTIVVGCSDGRVMILTLVLELCDPVRELLSDLPSRKVMKVAEPNPLSHDLRRLSSASPLSRLSARRKFGVLVDNRRPPTYQTLSNAVLASRQCRAIRSQACCIQ